MCCPLSGVARFTGVPRFLLHSLPLLPALNRRLLPARKNVRFSWSLLTNNASLQKNKAFHTTDVAHTVCSTLTSSVSISATRVLLVHVCFSFTTRCYFLDEPPHRDPLTYGTLYDTNLNMCKMDTFTRVLSSKFHLCRPPSISALYCLCNNVVYHHDHQQQR